MMILRWWFCFFVIGLIFLPIVSRLFSRFFDKGYLFSKTLGLLVAGYFVWLGASLKLTSFVRPTVLLSLAVAAVVIHLVWRVKPGLLTLIKENKTIFIVEEAIFLLALIFWTVIRGFQPNIQGLEKFMDFGFVNAILRSQYFPPEDMWFAGSYINYYYFGHYLTAFLTKLSNIPSSITYNLMMATLFALTFSLAFALGINFLFLSGKKWWRTLVPAGLITALLVALGGNLHTAIYAYAKPMIQSITHDKTPVKMYWYPEATRYIGYNPPTKDKTIHEFPVYSFVVSDLHGHVLNIPFVLTLLAVLLAFMVRPTDIPYTWRIWVPYSVLLGFFLAVFSMTNAWDVPIYLLLIGGVLLYKNYRIFGLSKNFLPVTMTQLGIIVGVFFLLASPFTLNFVNFAKGVGFVKYRSPIYQLLVLWGYQLFFFVLLTGILIRRYFQRRKAGVFEIQTTDIFVFLFGLLSLILIIIPEVVFVRDIYGESYSRANTMFKLTYQAFTLLALLAGYTTFRLLLIKKSPIIQIPLVFFLAIVLALPMIYPFYAIKGYYGNLSIAQYKGINGLQFLSSTYPDDYRAVLWLNKNIKGQPTILEANGDSYTDYGRISMATGLPTVLGWYVHEWLWRGDSKFPGVRVKEVAAVYETPDSQAAKDVIKKYHIRYIILGKLERDKFKKLDLAKLPSLGRMVFSSGTTQIIEVSQWVGESKKSGKSGESGKSEEKI